MSDHFTILDYKIVLFNDTLAVIVFTDVPCHLWLAYTYIEPDKNIVTSVERGLPKPGKPYYCFVASHENEQEEPGDTLTHTFIKPSWFVDQVRWWYCHGTINGDSSPSATGLVETRRVSTWTPATYQRFAGKLRWIWSGIHRPRSSGQSHAEVFSNPDGLTLLNDIYLYTHENDWTEVRLTIQHVDGDNLPTGPVIFTHVFVLSDGVFYGGIDPDWPHYRHHIPLNLGLLNITKYAITLYTIIGLARWVCDFRLTSWVGPIDTYDANWVTLWTKDFDPDPWAYAWPGYQAFELWGMR